MLPLHAAGIYDGPVAYRDDVSNYAVSSYTPTFTAFCRAVDQKPRVTASEAQVKSVLIFADQPNACGYSQLPHVYVEAEIVKRLVPPRRIMDPNESITTIAPHVELLHFACHGEQDQSNPLLSGLELQAGRLTLDQLTNITFPNGRLAYLSACETASVDSVCPDSGMNLATTFLFNGFRSVVGSMWYVTSLGRIWFVAECILYRSMQDVDGPFIAQRVYGRICKDGEIDYSAVPFALDEAVRELRESGVPASQWATFIHMGA